MVLTACFTDPGWTKEQTNELFELAKRFDTRFIVMADRISSQKSVEVLICYATLCYAGASVEP